MRAHAALLNVRGTEAVTPVTPWMAASSSRNFRERYTCRTLCGGGGGEHTTALDAVNMTA